LLTIAEASRDTTKLSAEAEAHKRRTLADAEGEAVKVAAAAASESAKLAADGEAYAQRTVAAAEADAINVRAESLNDGNQALIAANKLVDLLPEMVTAAASGLSGANLTVLNGADGIGQTITGVVGQGLAVYDSLRTSLLAQGAVNANGAANPLQNEETRAAEQPKRRPAARGQHTTSRPTVDRATPSADSS
jgi:flotillin